MNQVEPENKTAIYSQSAVLGTLTFDGLYTFTRPSVHVGIEPYFAILGFTTGFGLQSNCIFARSPWTQRACNIRGIANIKCVEPGSVDSKGVHLYRYCKFRGFANKRV